MTLTEKLEAIIITTAKLGRDTNIGIAVQEAIKAVRKYNQQVVGEDLETLQKREDEHQKEYERMALRIKFDPTEKDLEDAKLLEGTTAHYSGGRRQMAIEILKRQEELI